MPTKLPLLLSVNRRWRGRGVQGFASHTLAKLARGDPSHMKEGRRVGLTTRPSRRVVDIICSQMKISRKSGEESWTCHCV